jgi:hypothetical protein
MADNRDCVRIESAGKWIGYAIHDEGKWWGWYLKLSGLELLSRHDACDDAIESVIEAHKRAHPQAVRTSGSTYPL